MKLHAIITIFMVLLGSVNTMSQTNTQYYFLGYIYSRAEGQGLKDSKVYPYLPVVLKESGNANNILAVKVANGNGEVSFKGVPINIFKDYCFDILGLKGNDLKYRIKGTKEPYTFKSGNLTIHMRLPQEEGPYFKTEEFVFEKSEENTLLTEFLQKHVGLSYNDGSFFSKDGDLPYKLLINGKADFNGKKIIPMLPQMTGALIKVVKVIKYTNPNPYYEGVINLHLIQGEITDCSTVRTELLTYSIEQVK